MDHPVCNIFPKLWDRAQSDSGRRGRLVFAYVPKVKSRESITTGGRKKERKKAQTRKWRKQSISYEPNVYNI